MTTTNEATGLRFLPTPHSEPVERGVTLGAVWVQAWGDWLNDGYGWASKVEESSREGHRLRLVPSWGLDGWDLGDWPLVTYALGYVTETPADEEAPYRLLERVEGDVTCWAFATREELYAAVDLVARRYWGQTSDPEGQYGADMARALSETPEGERLPARFRGPFSWGRLKESKEAEGAAS